MGACRIADKVDAEVDEGFKFILQHGPRSSAEMQQLRVVARIHVLGMQSEPRAVADNSYGAEVEMLPWLLEEVRSRSSTSLCDTPLPILPAGLINVKRHS